LICLTLTGRKKNNIKLYDRAQGYNLYKSIIKKIMFSRTKC
jgi:hypothetical protein